MSMIVALYFSPCGGTGSIVKHVAHRLSDRLHLPYRLQSYTLPDERNSWTP